MEKQSYDKKRFSRRDNRYENNKKDKDRTKGSTYNRNNSDNRERDSSGYRNQSNDRNGDKYKNNEKKKVTIDKKSDKPSKNFVTSAAAKQLNSDTGYSDDQYETDNGRGSETETETSGNESD